MRDDLTDTTSQSVHKTVGTDVGRYTHGEPPPKLFAHRHTWPFDDPEAVALDLTPSQHGKPVRSAFTELLPADLSADERHNAWHRFLVDHPMIWPVCHGGLVDRGRGGKVLQRVGTTDSRRTDTRGLTDPTRRGDHHGVT